MSGHQKPVEVVYAGGPPPTNSVGIVGFVFAILGFVTCGLLSPVGLLISLVGLFKSPRGFATAGTIIGLLGSLWLGTVGLGLVIGFFFTKSAVESGVHAFSTMAAFEQGKLVVESYRQEHGELPDGIEGNKLVLDVRDGWQQGIRYALDEEGSYVLRSAGEDGEFHTSDDMTSDNDYAGLQIGSGDDEVRIGPGGINVEGDGERVRIGPDGIHIDSGDEEVRIDGGGVRVEDGEKD